MRFRGPTLARLIVLSAGLFITAPLPSTPVPADLISPECGPITSYRPEVRLRKLHLVRPDLIPYPIAYEVYC
ncbi:MAG: hypothetical protein JWM97_3202 [Phycisphaerales bacterium]|nr:hypothetical protein [Phycisphaerales bacterium]